MENHDRGKSRPDAGIEVTKRKKQNSSRIIRCVEARDLLHLISMILSKTSKQSSHPNSQIVQFSESGRIEGSDNLLLKNKVKPHVG